MMDTVRSMTLGQFVMLGLALTALISALSAAWVIYHDKDGPE